MVYDPQAKRQRPKPAPEGPAPVDALLLTDTADASGRNVVADTATSAADTATSAANADNEEFPLVTDDPPPAPTVTPEPANPPPDKLLINSALISAVGTLIGALVLRFLWKRWLQNDRPR